MDLMSITMLVLLEKLDMHPGGVVIELREQSEQDDRGSGKRTVSTNLSELCKKQALYLYIITGEANSVEMLRA